MFTIFISLKTTAICPRSINYTAKSPKIFQLTQINSITLQEYQCGATTEVNYGVLNPEYLLRKRMCHSIQTIWLFLQTGARSYEGIAGNQETCGVYIALY
jgi:hypothetical protein